MIGNEADAALALSAHATDYLFSDDGTSRYVYLINGVIYKVGRPNGEWANDEEYAKYLATCPELLPPYLRLPETHRYVIGDSTVIAAELIEGTPTGECFASAVGMECDCDPLACLSPLIVDDIAMHLDISDLAYGNVIIRDGIYYVVDFAC